jgi:SHS2 domain-containing protein
MRFLLRIFFGPCGPLPLGIQTSLSIYDDERLFHNNVSGAGMKECYFDHDADIGIIGRGKTLEACFADAARVMFALMGNLSEVRARETFRFSFEEADVELAFVTWLNLLLATANANNVIFSQFKILHDGTHWSGEALGEKWRDEMERGTDVKGATLTMLSVKQINHSWEGRCVVDV